MYSITNDLLKVQVKAKGAELCRITSVKNNTEFMWNADPDIWGNHAPNLFPVIGELKNNALLYDKEYYKMTKHGFIRNNDDIVLINNTANSLSFELVYNEKTLSIYPFKFKFAITFTLVDNNIEVKHTVENIDNKALYFSLGGHPAFNCPVFDNENYHDYYLEFEQIENSSRHLINLSNGLISSKTRQVFNNSNILPLSHDMFNEDALIFKNLKSRKVSLKNINIGEVLSVSFNDFNYLGIWAKPNANFVCIEPWLGLADHEDTNQKLEEKEGIIKLDVGNTFSASYKIAINGKLLN